MGQVTSASRLNVQFFTNGGVPPLSEKLLFRLFLPLLMSPFTPGGIIVREFYSAEDLGFLDRICGIIERLEDVHQRTLARSALVRTCMKKQPRGKFTVAAIPRLALHHLFS